MALRSVFPEGMHWEATAIISWSAVPDSSSGILCPWRERAKAVGVSSDLVPQPVGEMGTDPASYETVWWVLCWKKNREQGRLPAAWRWVLGKLYERAELWAKSWRSHRISTCWQPEEQKDMSKDSDIYFSNFQGPGTLLAQNMRVRKMNENVTGWIGEV